ncbi:hypothetical protein [Actinoplanes sp. RD1]|uniref:hypothetical protein n=1 Tax=Actinoplanes sp. RD1 TaxID=3064538 RepID=UPI002740C551|nr:hypothetical protein [Actinoplanes sp. RD1]
MIVIKGPQINARHAQAPMAGGESCRAGLVGVVGVAQLQGLVGVVGVAQLQGLVGVVGVA